MRLAGLQSARAPPVLCPYRAKVKPPAKPVVMIKTLEGGIRVALPEGSKAVFDEYVRARADLSDMACEEDFVAGYQLGVRMMLAGLDGKIIGE